MPVESGFLRNFHPDQEENYCEACQEIPRLVAENRLLQKELAELLHLQELAELRIEQKCRLPDLELGVDITTPIIAEEAYLAWERAGCPNGRDLEFWCEGERAVLGWTVGEIAEACANEP